MWTSIVTALILPLAVKLMGIYFNSKAATAEQRKLYLDFLSKWQADTKNTPSSIRQSYKDQIERAKKDEAASEIKPS